MGELSGIFAIYKEAGPSSHDIVDRIRGITGERKVGHAGTLDPLAKGVLVVAVGRSATRKLAEIVEKEKEYVATIGLGCYSSTDDAEGQKQPVDCCTVPTKEEVLEVLSRFVGTISQRPPVFSAVKVGGRPAYKLARANKKVDLPARLVVIKDIELLEYTWPYLKLRVVTGPGVYIRSLARDVGRALRTGGYLMDLERTRVGTFTVAEAMTLEQFKRHWDGLVGC